MKNVSARHLRAGAVILVGTTLIFAIGAGCNGELVNTPETTASSRQALSDPDASGEAGDASDDAADGASFTPPSIPGSTISAPLQLQVLTNSCGSNQMQDFFEVTNTGSTPINLSDISIKFWAYDTSGQAIEAHVWTGGCVVNVNGNPSCVHQVQGVAPTAMQFSPACGPSPTQQANWEITITNTDTGQLPPGSTWSNIQSALNLANYSNFSPGTADWYSGCLTGSSYAPSGQFAVYFQGNLVLSSAASFGGLTGPDCRLPSQAPFSVAAISAAQPPLNVATDVAAFLQWAYASTPSQASGARAAILAVAGNESMAQAIVNILSNDFDVGRNLVAISMLGELRTQTGLQYFTSLVNTPMPTTGTPSGFGTMPDEAVALSMLQARAVDGLALMMSPAADSVILNIIQTTQANQVLARAVHDYLWVHGAAGRTTVAALLDSQHQILLDRIDVIASGSSYNQRLANFLAAYPALNPAPPPPTVDNRPSGVVQ